MLNAKILSNIFQIPMPHDIFYSIHLDSFHKKTPECDTARSLSICFQSQSDDCIKVVSVLWLDPAVRLVLYKEHNSSVYRIDLIRQIKRHKDGLSSQTLIKHEYQS